MSHVIALVFDFDDTLAPDSTTKLLRKRGVDPDDFWKKTGELIAQGYDQTHAWLKLFLDEVGEDRALGLLTNQDLRDFGPTLDDDFFDGIPQLFEELQEAVADIRDTTIEFYVISGGLREVIANSAVIAKFFSGVYACELDGDTEDGPLKHIKRAVSFTEKTRYLFEINKGVPVEDGMKNPLLVNKDVDKADRRIPFENMIYVGDGLTDIPCFSLLESMGGRAFGVFDPTNDAKARKAFLQLLEPKRTRGTYSAEYTPKSALGRWIRLAVNQAIADAQLRNSSPYA